MKKTNQPQKRKPVQKRSSSFKKNHLLIGVFAVIIIGIGGLTLSALLNPNATKSLFVSINTSSLLGYAAGWNWVVPAQAPPNVQGTTPIWTTTVNNGSICFPSTAEAYLPFKVLQQAPVPVNPNTYVYYPITEDAAQEVETFPLSQPNVNDYFFLWADRCDAMPGSTPGNVNQCVGNSNQAGNPLRSFNTGSGATGQYTFKTYKTADDCTLAQEAASFGASTSTIDSYVSGDGLTLLTSLSNVQNLINANQLHNYCFINQATPAQAALNKGVFLDYEVGDKRTDSIATSFLQQVVTMAHNYGKKAILYTNPLDDSYTVADGIDSNDASTLLNMFDYMSLFLYGGNPEHSITGTFNAGLNVFKAGNPNVNFSHMMITYDLNGFSEADAQTAHSLMYQYNIPFMTIFRDGAQGGGACSTVNNQKLMCLLYAQCGGNPPTPPPVATLVANTPNSGSSTFTYSCTNSSASFLTTFGQLNPTASGTTAVRSPQTTTTYQLNCRGTNGVVATTTATITVNTALPDLTASLVPGTTPINVQLGAVVPLEAYVANIGNGPTGKPFWTTFFVNYEGQPFTQLEFPSGDPGPGNPPPGGFAPGIKEIDGTQGPGIKFTPTHTGRYSFRVCADRNASFTQTVQQSNATNDCSAWGGINVH